MSYCNCFFVKAEVPPVKDCLDLKALGVKASGRYRVDFTGDRDLSKAAYAYCYDGWTVILQRGSFQETTNVSFLRHCSYKAKN